MTPAARIAGVLRRHAKLIMAMGIGYAASSLLPASLSPGVRGLIGWDIAALLYIGATFFAGLRSSVDSMRRHAQEDEGAGLVLALVVAATAVSFYGIALVLTEARSESGHPLALLLALVTIVCSWSLLHTLFALRYAHIYYGDMEGPGEGDAGGLIFPDTKEPAFDDFLYVAFVIGAAAQTADVAFASRRMRRVGLAHGTVSFLFNTTILALAVNAAVTLL